MASIAITSDLNGHIFSVDHDGALFHNQHRGPGVAGPLLYPGPGIPIGSGWQGITLFAATRAGGWIVLAGVTPDDQLVSAQSPLTGIDQWTAVTPQPDGATWPNLASMFGAPDGVLYAIDGDGQLQRRRYQAATGATSGRPLQPSASEVVGPGWQNRPELFTNGEWFFDVASNGDLQYQTTAMTNPDPVSNWVTLERAWFRFQTVFGAGPRGIYAVGTEGALELQRFAFDPAVRLLPRTADDRLASGIIGWCGLKADIEGYCWPQSLRPGQTVDFKVATRLTLPSVKQPVSYSVDFRRLRRMHNGVEGMYDEIMETGPQGSTAMPAPLPADWLATGAQWRDGFSKVIPATPPGQPGSWRSGLYAARCVDARGNAYCIPFVVRPAVKTNALAIIANTNTWNAYNSWGGHGKYVHAVPVPGTLPYDRPHPGLTPDVTENPCQEIQNQSHHLLRAELWVLGWLEDLGARYAYDMFTDQDLHEGIAGIGDGNAAGRYKGLILNTHPEYWTRDAYDRVKRYQEDGGSIVYLGGNGIYEEVVLENGGRRMAIFPDVDRSKFDEGASNQTLRMHCLLRGAAGRPERALIGVGFETLALPNAQGQPFQLCPAASANPAMAGITPPADGLVGKASENGAFHADGWEVDVRGPATPVNANATTALLALGPTPAASGHMLYYETGHGGVVFSASSLSFGGCLPLDPTMQQIVQNALDQCLAH